MKANFIYTHTHTHTYIYIYIYRKEKITGGKPHLLFSEVEERIRLCKTGNCGSICENGREFSAKTRQFLTL